MVNNMNEHFVESYNLRILNSAIGYFTKDEILEIKSFVISELIKEDLESTNPDIMLIYSNYGYKILIIHAIQDNEYRYNGIESRNRTFTYENGKLVDIEKGEPKVATELRDFYSKFENDKYIPVNSDKASLENILQMLKDIKNQTKIERVWIEFTEELLEKYNNIKKNMNNN
jgi:hypothetical protein